MNIKDLKRRYKSPTPARWVAVGESISLLGTTMTATLAGMEVATHWIITSAIVTWFGQTIVKFVSPKTEENENN